VITVIRITSFYFNNLKQLHVKFENITFCLKHFKKKLCVTSMLNE